MIEFIKDTHIHRDDLTSLYRYTNRWEFWLKRYNGDGMWKKSAALRTNLIEGLAILANSRLTFYVIPYNLTWAEPTAEE